MGINFNADEIFEIAEQIERNGAAFYRKAAEEFPGEQAGKLLLGLAAMEDEHLATFMEMRRDLSVEKTKPTVFDPDGEARLYLQALADGSVFDVSVEPATLLRGDETLEEILKVAIGLEKDSVVFYTGIRHLVPASFGRDKVEAIIAEEMKHIALLGRQLASTV